VSASIEEILGEATKLEKEYEWLQASEFYGQALGMVDSGDHFRRGEVQEKIGHSLHRAAFQAESREEFLERLGKAVEAYEVARGIYEKSGDENAAWVLRCRAVSKYLSHWIAPDPSEKLLLLSDCHELEGGALDSFWDTGNKLEYCRTYNELAQASELLFLREWDQQLRKEVLEERSSWGERTISVLLELNDSYEAARAHFSYFQDLNAFYKYFEPTFFTEIGDKTFRSRVYQHVHEAFKYADEVGDDYTTGLCYIHLEGDRISNNSERRRNYFKKALECGEKTKDIYLKNDAFTFFAYSTYWRAHSTEDPDLRLRLAEEAMGYYDESQQYSSIMSFQASQIGKLQAPAPGGYAEYYWDRARWEVTLENKLELLEKSEKAGLEALKAAEASDLPSLIGRMYHLLSGTLTDRARLEQDDNTKRGSLEKAMEYREKNIEIMEGLGPLHYWNMGIYQNLLGNIKVELALIEPDPNKKVELLEDAKSRKEKALSLIDKMLPRFVEMGNIGNFAILSRYQDGHGTTLTRLYELTNDREHLRTAIDVWLNVIEVALKVPLFGRIAESYWKIAKTYDIMNEYSEAAENFKQASESYLKATESIPQLKDFYQEYSTYMQAWSEIENARHHHAEKHYGEAKEHYEKAAELHDATERWSYLRPNYLAWARVEEAEALSRREQTQEARDLFQQAAKLFGEAQKSIGTKLNTIEVGEERQIAEDLIKASDVRREYCLGRGALEEARILDRQGDHSTSSKRYGQAVEKFQGVIDTFELESERRELRPIVYLCRAWQKMMLAEDEMSSSLYSEAAELFMEARVHALDQTTRLLAQAHSSFCKALEAGTRFELTRETELFSEAKRHIEASTGYYLRAGQQTMSDYAGATSRFLDAYLYTYNAQTEADPKKKAQFYQMAERLLQSSAGAYLKAKHPEKSEEIRRILGRVKEEREIAVSLSEVLHTPSLVSTTASFSIPTPTYEQAVGLERFESANIQANLITRRREVGVGEDLDLEIELVNAGKAPAQLVKVEDIVIDGFELKSFPDICRVEDSYLDMKGRTLSPLKTQELKLVLKPLAKGSFELKPRILYLDEAGKYRSHEPEPVTITVQELGIKGWLRGPTR